MQNQTEFKLKKFISQNEISEAVKVLASRIDEHYSGLQDDLICVGVLKGAWMFLADLVREMKTGCVVDFIRATSYGVNKESSGLVKILKDVEVDLKGKHVLLVEEIIDSGRTLSLLKARMQEAGVASVKIVTLLDKKSKRVVDIDADFVGRQIEDAFVVGYGLDWAERYRQLPDIYIV